MKILRILLLSPLSSLAGAAEPKGDFVLLLVGDLGWGGFGCHGDMKLIEFFEGGELELYNLKDDPKEINNLALAHPEKARALLKDLVAWRKSVGAQMMSGNPNCDPNARRSSKRK